MRAWIQCAAVVVVLAGGASAQSFNIDIGHWGNVPSNACGAGTGQKGFWNAVGHDTPQVALLDLAGHGTSATVEWPVAAYDDGIHELAGNDAQMLNDYQLLGINGVSTDWLIHGMQDGPYRVTFYSRLPNAFGVAPHVDFTLSGGALGMQSCSGILDIGFNGYRYGVNMVQDTIVVTNGTIAWNVLLSNGEYGAFNGVQIEALAPGAVRAYCTAKTNSLGCVPAITSSGVPSATGSAFTVLASSERSHRPGLLVWSRLQNGMPYYGGSLCVASPFVRTAPQDSGGAPGVDDCSGTYSFAFDATVLALAGLNAGDVVACQYWSVDEAAEGGNALTRGLTFVIAP